MKRILSLLAVIGLVFTAGSAMAGVQTTPHEYGTAAYGICEVCHVPHAASATTATRLWREDRTITHDGTWTNSTVGQLCGTCHTNTGALAATANTNGGTPTDQLALAFDATSHDRDWTVLTGTLSDTQDANIASKPYTTGTKIEGTLIECTSCHNPHDDTVRPFLRENTAKTGTVSGFCADCHVNRYSTTVTDITSAVTILTADTMHPINVAYTDNATNGGTYFQPTPNAALRTLVGAPSSATPWALGGKFEGALSSAPGAWSGENIGCGTCHSVHDVATQTVTGDDALHLLALDNAAANAGLCEGCHGGPASGQPVGSVVGDHPIDMEPGTGGGPAIGKWIGDGGTATTTKVEQSSITDYWPYGDVAGAQQIICTSCHSAHNSGTDEYRRLTRDLYTDSATNGGSTGFCQACHGDPSPLGHHSNRYNGFAGAAGGGLSEWPTGVNATATGVDCFDCHNGGAFGGAHNGFSFTFTNAQNQYSDLCNTCHVGGVTDPAFDYTMPAEHLDAYAAGTKSHYIGAFTDSQNSINVKRNTWTYGKSKYGAGRSNSGWGDPAGLSDTTGSSLICESCHSVLWNLGADPAYPATSTSGYLNNLLLQNYIEDKDAAGPAVGSGLCVGCHNQGDEGNSAANTVSDALIQNDAVAPANMHPMTAWSITKAQDTGRSPVTLITESPGYADNAYGIAPGAKASGVSYPAVDEMDCDSCHTPHRAASTGGGTYDQTQQQPGTAVSVILEESGPGANEFDNLCLECHNY